MQILEICPLNRHRTKRQEIIARPQSQQNINSKTELEVETICKVHRVWELEILKVSNL